MLALLIIALNTAPEQSGALRGQGRRPQADTAGVEQGMREYFAGEEAESYVFVGAGLASLGAAVPLFIAHGDVLRPMSVPLAVFGVIELVLGVGLWMRTPGQVRGLVQLLGTNPSGLKEQESRRLLGVMMGFQVYRAFELTVGAAGAFMAGLGYVRDSPAVCGVGLGLLVEAAVLLALDFFAEARGRKYQALLADFVP